MLIRLLSLHTHTQHRHTKEIKNKEYDLLAESPCACWVFDVDYNISVHLGQDDEDYGDGHDDDHDGGGFAKIVVMVVVTMITSVNTNAVSKPMPTCVNAIIIKSLYLQESEKEFLTPPLHF